jgi:hypothetical protein
MTWRRIQERAAAQPTATAIVLYAIVAMAALLAAYFSIFTVFAPYDDEGTLLVGLKAFVNGDVLYRDIWSVYGPFYYEVFGGFFKLFGLSITTDASRTIVILVWVSSSLLFGVAAQRLTGRLALGLTAMIAAFSALGVLVREPMHPQGLCVLLLGAFAFFAVGGLAGRTRRAGAICGALLAALVLTKVNLGVFAGAATVLALVLSIEPIYRRQWLRWVICIAFVAMPVAVLARDLDQSWVREFALMEILAAVAVLAASRPLRPTKETEDGKVLDWGLAAVVGFVVAFVAIIVAIIATGPSPADVYQGVVKDALGIREVLTSQFQFPLGTALIWGIATVVAAVIASSVRLAAANAAASLWTGLLRALAGLAILCSVATIVPFTIGPSAGSPDLLPMFLAWVAVVPPAGVAEMPFKRFLRLLLPLAAVAETLQVYPVPGSQTGIAAVFFALVGALCLADSWVDLRAWSDARGAVAARNFATSIAVVAIAVPAAFGLNAIVLPGMTAAVNYHNLPSLKLPGAELMHLGDAQVESYEALVELLHKNHCSTFVGWPTVNSLYLWSGLEPPRPSVPNAWFRAASESQQQLAVEELRASRRPCAILNEELAGLYLAGQEPPQSPLVKYFKDEFEPIEIVGPFEFELPKPSATKP